MKPDRHPYDRGVNGLDAVMRDIERLDKAQAHMREYHRRKDEMARLADLRSRPDYSDDGPGALAMMLVCVAVSIACYAAAFWWLL